MDILIVGLMCAIGIGVVVFIKFKVVFSSYVESMYQAQGSRLVCRYVKAYKDDTMSLDAKSDILDAIISDMIEHEERAGLFVKNMKCELDLPDNVTCIKDATNKAS